MLSIKHVIILVVAVLLLSIGAAAFYKIFFTAHSIKIGYIFPGPVNEKGWNMEHYDAVKKACAHQGLELIYRDNVPEAMDPASRAVESLIDEGALAAEAEIAILMEYLPKQLSEDEVRSLVKEAIAASGAASPKDMGKVMKELMPKVKGRADGKLVNEIVKELLAQ